MSDLSACIGCWTLEVLDPNPQPSTLNPKPYHCDSQVSDLSACIGCGTLEVLDLEGNAVSDMEQIGWLAGCERLSALTLEGNPVSSERGYRRKVLDSIPSLCTLDDFDRGDPIGDDDEEEGQEEEAGGLGSGGGGGDSGVGAGLDDSDYDPCNTSVVAPLREGGVSSRLGKDKAELMVVHQGIKHARLGFDDAEFFDGAAQSMSGRPGTGGSVRPGSAGGRVGTASFRPGSAMSRPPQSPGGSSTRSGGSEDGRGGTRPGSSSSGGVMYGHASRPMSAMSMRRPSTAMSQSRPGTAAASPGRPQSAMAGGREAAWAARRSARQGWRGGAGGGDAGDDGHVASDLTFNTDEVYCGNLTRGLKRRNVALAVEKYSVGGVGEAAAGDGGGKGGAGGVGGGQVEMTTDEVGSEQ